MRLKFEYCILTITGFFIHGYSWCYRNVFTDPITKEILNEILCLNANNYTSEIAKLAPYQPKALLFGLSNIPTVENDSFIPIQSVEHLSLDFCNIETVEDRAFRNLSDLRELTMKENSLTVIKSIWFEGLDKLEYIFLEGNRISRIDAAFGLVVNKLNLKSLGINSNQLRELPDGFLFYVKEDVYFDYQDNPWSFDQEWQLANWEKSRIIELRYDGEFPIRKIGDSVGKCKAEFKDEDLKSCVAKIFAAEIQKSVSGN